MVLFAINNHLLLELFFLLIRRSPHHGTSLATKKRSNKFADFNISQLDFGFSPSAIYSYELKPCLIRIKINSWHIHYSNNELIENLYSKPSITPQNAISCQYVNENVDSHSIKGTSVLTWQHRQYLWKTLKLKASTLHPRIPFKLNCSERRLTPNPK